MVDSVEDELRCMWSNALAVAEGGGRQREGRLTRNVVGWLGLIGNDTAIGAYRNLFWRRWLVSSLQNASSLY